MTEDRFKAQLAGDELTIIGHASKVHLRATERLLNRQFKQIELIAPNLSKEEKSLLLAFNAFSDQLLLQQRINELEKK